MAKQSSFLAALKSDLPESCWPWLIPALRQDEVVWSALQETEFFGRALAAISNVPENWSPAALAFLQLGYPLPSPDTPLDAQLRFQALQAFEALNRKDGVSQSSEGDDIRYAALLAISLLEHRRLSGSWSGLPSDLHLPVSKNTSILSIWFTSLAILFGIAEDRLELLKTLLTSDPPGSFISLALHAFLSTPQPPAKQLEMLLLLLKELSFNTSALIVLQLAESHPELATRLARYLVIQNPKDVDPNQFYIPRAGLSQLADLYLTAELLALAGHKNQATATRWVAIQAIHEWQTVLACQISRPDQDQNLDAALQTWLNTRVGPTDPVPPPGLIIGLLEAGRIDEALDLLPRADSPESQPLVWLIQAHLALRQGDLSACRQAVRRVLQAYSGQFSITQLQLRPYKQGLPEGLSPDLPFFNHLIVFFLALYLPEEALRTARLASSLMPNNVDLLKLLSQAARMAGDPNAAAQAAHLAVALDPENSDLRRELAASLEFAGDWQAALVEWTNLLDPRFTHPDDTTWPTAAEWRALANCALHAGDTGLAVDACQSALSIDPEDGLAHAILGDALSACGEDGQALEHFSLATRQAPHQLAPWLSLARAYEHADQRAKSIETLRSGSHAVPDEPAVHLALAEAYLQQNDLTLAQASLRKAHDLVTSPISLGHRQSFDAEFGKGSAYLTRDRNLRCQVALLYGQVLRQLGHLETASLVFEAAYQDYPAYPGLAYAYARLLLDENDPQAALAPLVVAVGAEMDDPHPYLDYARALLEVGSHPEEAANALQRVLDLADPTDPDSETTRQQAQALLGQAFEASGDLPAALQAYYRALDSRLAHDALWRERLSLGLGRVALHLNQPETAIAALHDAAHDEKPDLEVSIILSEAYASINLPEEALASAHSAIQQAPDNIETLNWFARQAIRLGAQEEAIPTLTRAFQLDTQRIDLLINLAQVQCQLGETFSARDTFRQVLASPHAKPDHLYLAAKGSYRVEDSDTAIACLERALELSDRPSAALLRDLAGAYRLSGDGERALEILDRAVQVDPDDTDLHILKADLLLELDRPQASQACLEHALRLKVNDPQIHQRLAELMRIQGALTIAMEYAEKAVDAYEAQPDEPGAAYAFAQAADLARALLRHDYARSLLAIACTSLSPSCDKHLPGSNAQPLATIYCLAAELALEQEEEVAAAQALTQACELSSTDPRIMALQARLTFRRGDAVTAASFLQAGLEAVGWKSLAQANPEVNQPATGQAYHFMSLALAALDLYQWELCLDLLSQAIGLAPREPYLHLQVARAFVLRGEFQRFCDLLNVQAHAPGPAALSDDAFQALQNALRAVETASEEEGLLAESPLLLRWRARGQAAFRPGIEGFNALNNLPLTPSDRAAQIAALSLNGDLPLVLELYKTALAEVDDLPLDHFVQAQFAITMGLRGRRQDDLDESQAAARSALEQQPNQPIYHALMAKLAQNSGDQVVALQSIQTALVIWPDEPRWHAQAADICLSLGDSRLAIDHLEQAVALEPTHLPHHMALGRAYSLNSDTRNAIHALEDAAKLNPNQMEPFLALAQVYQANNNLTKAATNADQAVIIAPDHLEAQILRAEIALEMDEPEVAQEHAKAALRIKPEHPSALFVQARALQNLGCSAEALSVIEKAIPIAPDPLPLYLERVHLLECTLGPEVALESLHELAARYPDEPTILAPLAQAFARSGQRDLAIRAAQRGLRNGNDSLNLTEQARLHFLLGRLLRQSGQLDQALHQLSEATRLAPLELEPYLELGATQLERRQHALALQTYQKAITVAPRDPRPYYQAGLALKTSRDYQGAENMLRRAADLAPDDLAIHRQLAALVALNLVHNRRSVTLDA